MPRLLYDTNLADLMEISNGNLDALSKLTDKFRTSIENEYGSDQALDDSAEADDPDVHRE